MKSLLFVTALFLSVSAQAKPAQCLLVVDGKTYLNGTCNFESEKGGSFTIGVGSEKVDSKYFAYVNIFDDGTVNGYWNGDEANSSAHNDLGELKRNGACRFNDRAIICAWAL